MVKDQYFKVKIIMLCCYVQKLMRSLRWVALLLSLPALSFAHPHAWIELQVTVLANANGEATGLAQEWLFDPYYSIIVLEDMGADVEGSNADEWLNGIAQQMLANLADFSYFTEVTHGDESIKSLTPGDYQLRAEGDQLRLRFELLWPTPLALSTTPLRYAIADPTYYIEMLHHGGTQSIQVDPALNCKVKIRAPNPSPRMIARAAALDVDQMGDPTLGRHFAERVVIQCD